MRSRRTSDEPLDPPDEPSRFVILTSGTTGTPEGGAARFAGLAGAAGRPAGDDSDEVRANDRDRRAALSFLGFRELRLRPRARLDLRAPPPLRSRGDARDGRRQRRRCPRRRAGDAAADHGARPEVLDRYDLPTLRVTAASGSSLPGDLATRWMDAFGDNLYNFYGSTEVGWATIATPEDMRIAPGTAGRPPRGTDDQAARRGWQGACGPGETGRIFVGNDLSFEGYTGGGGKDIVDGMLSSGDVGHFDERRPPVHRRPRRRDDRLRGRERLPAGGRGPARRPRGNRRGGRDRRRRRAVRPAPQGLRRRQLRIGARRGRVRSFIKENLARYKVPREVEFMDELPRNPTGKVLKRELE